MQLKFLILAGAMCMPTALLAQAAPAADLASPVARPAFDKADAERAVTELATALEENFVFPDKGKPSRRLGVTPAEGKTAIDLLVVEMP